MEFVIPLCREDLLRGSANHYVVEDTVEARELQTKLVEFKDALTDRGAGALWNHFDVFFSALKYVKTLDADIRQELWDLLLTCHSIHYNDLVPYLEDAAENGHASVDNQRDHRNTLMMNVYLLTQYADVFETESSKASEGQAGLPTNKKTKRGQAAKGCQAEMSSNSSWNWQEQKRRLLRTLKTSLQLPLNILWNPPVADDQFVNAVVNCVCKFLENVEAGKVRSSETNEDIIDILGLMIEHYRYATQAGAKIAQLLLHSEHLSSVLVLAVHRFATNHRATNIVFDLFRELADIEGKNLSREGSNAKSLSTFLVELTPVLPAAVFANISLLMCYLDDDSHTLRNAILAVMEILIEQKFQGENLEEKDKRIRDKFLERLQEHLHDKNAFVRSKVLQLWTKLAENKCVPLVSLKVVLPLIVGRLVDKSSTVRKATVQFLTIMLRQNPFMAQFSLTEVKEKYLAEKTRLDDMCQKMNQNGDERRVIANAEAKWKELEDDVEAAVIEWLEDHFDAGGGTFSTSDKTMDDTVPVDVLLKAVFDLLSERKFAHACSFLILTRNAHPDNRAFIEWHDDKCLETTKLSILASFKIVFWEHTVAADLIKSTATNNRIEERHESAEDSGESGDESNAVCRQQQLVSYLQDAYIFADYLLKALPQISIMLRQQQTSDVLEAIEFAVTCAEFGISGANEAVWECCRLIWSKETAIRDAVLKAFQRLYLSTESTPNTTDALVAKNLIALTINANASQLTSLDEVVSELVKRRLISVDVCQLLWEYFTLRIPNGCTKTESKAALKLIAMAAKSEKSIIIDNMDILIEFGLGKRAMQDFELAKDAFCALEKLAMLTKNKTEESIKITPLKLDDDHALFSRISALVVDGFWRAEDPMWCPMAEHALRVMYGLSKSPNVLAVAIMQSLLGKWQTLNEKIIDTHIVRLLNLIGQLALETFIYLDFTVFDVLELCTQVEANRTLRDNFSFGGPCQELKRREFLQTESKRLHHKPIEQNSTKNNRKEKRSKMRSSGVSAASETSQSNLSDPDEELHNIIGTSAEDPEYEFVSRICEDSLLSDGCLLGQLSNVVILVCKNPHKYSCEEVQTAATLALSKLMLTSSKFCEANLALFFTMLDRSESVAVRANLVIAVNDLSVRFPNLVEPWTAVVYKRLHDPDLTVRLNCLLILNHLILNDMIKPKGYIADVALCTLDEDSNVNGLAKKFFLEYAERGNWLYNFMPDIISRLSDQEAKLDFDGFRTVMKFLFSLIQKERQCENLIEKICQRFVITNTLDQWQRLSYCLTLPNYSERSLKKLQENLNCYALKLGDQQVYDNFVTLLNNAKKRCKPEYKLAIEEFRERIDELRNKQTGQTDKSTAADRTIQDDDDFVADMNATKHLQTPAKVTRKTRSARSVQRRREQSDSSDS